MYSTITPPMAYNHTGYRFGFNGQEKDDEITGQTGSHYDFGARMYDSRLGRWLAVDPLAGKYPFASPYNFALNTPIQAVDPDGKLVIFVNGYHNGAEGLFFGITGSSILTELGMKKYWGGLDDKIAKRIGDENRYYSDGGTRNAYTSAQLRYNLGVQEGKAMLNS